MSQFGFVPAALLRIVSKQNKPSKTFGMKKNMGTIDRALRAVVALVMLGLYFGNIVTGTLGVVLVVASIIFLLTSLVSFCPLYTLFGFSTCATK